MASAGMGDALTGLVAALRAQGRSPFDAAWVGALAHSAAADSVGRRRGLLASDVIVAFARVLNP
jgi:NAD(P)H-hydrate epimerase